MYTYIVHVNEVCAQYIKNIDLFFPQWDEFPQRWQERESQIRIVHIWQALLLWPLQEAAAWLLLPRLLLSQYVPIPTLYPLSVFHCYSAHVCCINELSPLPQLVHGPLIETACVTYHHVLAYSSITVRVHVSSLYITVHSWYYMYVQTLSCSLCIYMYVCYYIIYH